MAKKLLWWFFTVGFVVTFPTVLFAATFPDVPENTEYYGAVEYMVGKGVIQGYPDGSFKPDKPINRAEALKVLLLAYTSLKGELEVEANEALPFPDVNAGQWFYEYVLTGYNLGIVEGYPDGTFKPGDTINIAESIKLVFLQFDVSLSENLESDPYPDVKKDIWYALYADYSKRKNLIEPLDNGNLDAGRKMTRADFVRLMYRFLYIEENNLDSFPLNINWPVIGNIPGKYTVKYPYKWAVIEADDQLILWKKDEGNNQISFARTYPNSATVVIAVDQNESRLSLGEYLKMIDYGEGANIQTMTLNGYPFSAISLSEQGIADYYFEFPNKSILVAYTQVGDGANRPFLAEQIRFIIGSIRYDENASKFSEQYAKEQFLSTIRQIILVEGEGQSALDAFDDLIIIETDTIGIGTGPVDYYYSEEYDVTLKYERNSSTLLAIRDSNSTAF
jgi:hypothetical protein